MVLTFHNITLKLILLSFFDYITYNIPEKDSILQVDAYSSILIVVDGSIYSEPESALLRKILHSVKQDLDSAQVIEVSEQDYLNFKSLDKSPTLVLVFGIDSSHCCLQVEKTPYKLITVNSTTYIFSHPLNELPDQPANRRALWEALKEYYKIT